jgi:AhpD family alkylhydroperoxidase
MKTGAAGVGLVQPFVNAPRQVGGPEQEKPSMSFLSQHFPEFTAGLDKLDKVYDDTRVIDRKTDELIRFALSVRARSQPCVLKHFKGAIDAGAEEREIAYILALVMREAAGAEDCWTHDVLGNWQEIIDGRRGCGCS